MHARTRQNLRRSTQGGGGGRAPAASAFLVSPPSDPLHPPTPRQPLQIDAGVERGIMASGLLLLMTAGLVLIVKDTLTLTGLGSMLQ